MGMALDEPKDDDEKFEESGMTLVMAPDVVGMAREMGGVAIDYVDDGRRQGYTISMGAGSACDSGGGCGDGGSCCSG